MSISEYVNASRARHPARAASTPGRAGGPTSRRHRACGPPRRTRVGRGTPSSPCSTPSMAPTITRLPARRAWSVEGEQQGTADPGALMALGHVDRVLDREPVPRPAPVSRKSPYAANPTTSSPSTATSTGSPAAPMGLEPGGPRRRRAYGVSVHSYVVDPIERVLDGGQRREVGRLGRADLHPVHRVHGVRLGRAAALGFGRCRRMSSVWCTTSCTVCTATQRSDRWAGCG